MAIIHPGDYFNQSPATDPALANSTTYSAQTEFNLPPSYQTMSFDTNSAFIKTRTTGVVVVDNVHGTVVRV